MTSYGRYNYPRYWAKRRYENAAEKLVLKRFFRDIPKESLIDIGAGYGRLSLTYAPLFQNCLLVEPSAKLLSKAKKRLSRFPNLKFAEGRAQELPAENRQFDVALMVRVSHHLANLEAPFREVYRVLRPNGYFIFEFANKINFKSSLKAVFKRRFTFFYHLPVNLSRGGSIDFKNYHPNQILTLLGANGFEVVTTASVSNFRQPIIKKIVPLPWLLFLENGFSRLSSFFPPLRFFGPSVFVLARKVELIAAGT